MSTNMFASADFKLGLFKILSLWIGDSGFEHVRTWEVVEPVVVSSTTSQQLIKFGPRKIVLFHNGLNLFTSRKISIWRS